MTDVAERERFGWLVVTWLPYDPAAPPTISLRLEPQLQDPAPPTEAT